ncbi:YdaS family helix-turn-helix protein [Herbaspirillum sp. WKF16]|uniref:transcriptional regulator n=1 Tax=Herbaspirillum sp. WKF16 TaxID=3028312 RepID=UPI0023A9A5FF|nr:YdaS family helix-turn-helix protein [Herbaspirillum sp. WKF16]WDZ97955.1 YdaS family helix-turn-helix protein [Herbaspirillum sp. WKF16]
MDQIEETGIATAVRLAGSQTALARGITQIAEARGASGVTPQAVQKWVAQGFAPPERCREIEDFLDMRVTRYRLNPGVFGSPEEALAAARQPDQVQP